MLLKIAWRNIWRNPLRSMVVIFSIVLGIWAGLFVLALTLGLNNQRTQGFIKSSLSHIQIHDSAFLKDRSIANNIKNADALIHFIQSQNSIKYYSLRTILNGMAATATASGGVNIIGIDPNHEKKVSNIFSTLTEGDYFEENKKNRILVGEKLSHKLNVKVGSRIILTFQDKESNLISAAFKVCGIFKTLNSGYDEGNVFVQNEDLFRLLNSEPNYEEVAIIASDFNNLNPIISEIKTAFPTLDVQTWDELAPELGYANKIMSKFMYIFIMIILLALAFGIVNTMLMAVLERKHELGMLMAIGMNKLKVFSMIVIETILLSFIGGPLGICLAWLTITYFGKNGIDLAMVAKGLESLGIGRIIYTEINSAFYFQVGLMIILTAILASVYPAIKALKLKPAEAVRSI